MNLKKNNNLLKNILSLLKKIEYKLKKSFLQTLIILFGLTKLLATFCFNGVNKKITIFNYQTYIFNLPEPATTQMIDMLMFNKSLIFLMVVIVLLIAWLLFFTMLNFQDFNINLKPKMFYFNALEMAWTSLPALALLKVAAPSISILYSLDEDTSSSLRLKVLGNQWFWSYEIDISSLQTRFKNEGGTKIIRFSSYILSQEKIEKQKCLGLFRLLETNKRIVLPVKKSIIFLITSLDVLHSWSLPTCGIKVDACPGKLNQANTIFQRVGTFFGQCSEICGVNHGFMPIVLMSTKNVTFLTYLENSLNGNYGVKEEKNQPKTLPKWFLVIGFLVFLYVFLYWVRYFKKKNLAEDEYPTDAIPKLHVCRDSNGNLLLPKWYVDDPNFNSDPFDYRIIRAKISLQGFFLRGTPFYYQNPIFPKSYKGPRATTDLDPELLISLAIDCARADFLRYKWFYY